VVSRCAQKLFEHPHVKCPLGLSNSNKIGMFPSIKSHENPFVCSLVIIYGHRLTDVSKVIGAFLQLFVVCASPTSAFQLSALAVFGDRKLKVKKSKAVPLHAMEALGGRGGIAPTHS
jgi:hypothetical protein